MLQKIRTYVKENNLIELNDKIVAGISGGADSMALLLILLQLREEFDLEIFVVHINHGIREDAKCDEKFVSDFCNSKDLPFFVYHGDIRAMAKEQGKSEEEMGRVFRYQCFHEVCEKQGANKIAVAHHKNDQVETILFHMIRGTNLKGLAGMKPSSRTEEQQVIIRPLLGVERREIEQYLLECGQNWCEDYTNKDNSYARNSIRNQMIPCMEELNDQAVSHIARLAEEMREYDDMVSAMVERYHENEVSLSSDGMFSLNRNELSKQPAVFSKAVLYELLCRASGRKKDISNVHVEELFRLIFLQSGKQVDLPYGLKAKNVYEKLVLGHSDNISCNQEEQIYFECKELLPESPDVIRVPMFGKITLEVVNRNSIFDDTMTRQSTIEQNMKNHYTKYFDYDRIKGTLCLRTPRMGDYITIHEDGMKKKLSRYFKDIKIDVDMRGRVPVLAQNQEVLWIIGYRRCEHYKVTNTTERILKVTYEGEEYGSY